MLARRIRIGIGRSGRPDVSDFVLSDHSTAGRKDVPFQVYDGADAGESLVRLRG